jgi:PAS domain S-box-containing protein
MFLEKAKNYLKSSLYERLSVQMMFLTFLSILILTCITTYMQVYHETEHYKEELSSQIDSIHNQVLFFISRGIINNDTESLNRIMDKLIDLPAIAYLELFIYNDENEDREIIRGEKPDLEFNKTIVKTKAIFDTDGVNQIAQIEIITDPDFISRHVQKKLTLIVSLSLFITVSVSATILLLVHSLIIKHLRYLVDETQDFSVDNIDKTLHLPNREDDIFRNELDILVNSINAMRKAISNEIKSNEQKKISLKNQRDFSNTLLNSCSMIICRLDSDFKIVSINSATTMITGLLEFEVIGKPWLETFVDEKQRAETDAQIHESTYTILNDLIMKDSQRRSIHMQWNFVPFYEENNLKYHIAFGYDITQLKETQEQLIKLNNELESKIELRTQTLKTTNEELSRAYQELKETQKQLIEAETMSSLGSLVSGIAHEINTPLGISVTAYTLIAEQIKKIQKLIKEPEIDREALQDIIDIIVESDDLLTSNLRRGSELIRSFKQVAVDSSSNVSYSFNVKENLSQTLISLSNVVKKEKLHISVECQENLDIYSYPGALTQIYTNLIMNSANHAWNEDKSNRKILISITSADDHLVISYQDNGNGISPEILDKIYEPFVTSKRGRGGSGLGANIIYNLTTQLLNGKIECHNLEPPLHGACFTISFPLNREEKKETL